MDLIKILEKCPKGIELYSIVHGAVTFDFIEYEVGYPIRCIVKRDGSRASFTAEGRYLVTPAGECVLFPSKDNRDWNTFQIPIEFKVGDHVKYISRDIIGNKIYRIGKVDQCFAVNACVDCLDNTHINHSKESLIKIDKFDDSLLYPGMPVLCKMNRYNSSWVLCSFSHKKNELYWASALKWDQCIPL